MNREMLKEAIAEAKTIKETAIASAKLALEEAFTPQLTAMFAEKLNELDEEEMDESVNEMYSEEEELEEDFNLEEILAELEMTDEAEDAEEIMDTEEELDEDLTLEEMSDEDIETLVTQVIDDMIASGKLMAGEESEEEESEEEMEMDDMEMGDEEEAEDEDINIEELLAEMDSEKEKVEEMDYMDPYVSGGDAAMIAAAVLAGVAGLAWTSLDKEKRAEYIAKAKALPQKVLQSVKQMAGLSETADNAEMEETISELRNELNEVNLLNAKLLYTNKIFKTKNLTESEKIKVLNTFDKATNVKEVKLVYESLVGGLKTKSSPIKESLGRASKTITSAAPKQPIVEVNEAFARMQRLAGITK